MSNSPRCAKPGVPHHTSGFSLLEVLISLVIMSVGLLGVAGLMSTTLKSNDSAYMRSQATAQAYNIIDRMRANMTGVNAGNYVVGMPPSAATGALPSTCTVATCTSPALATYDIGQWEYDLAKFLPQGRGSISVTLSPGNTTVPAATTYTVTVLWNDSRASQALGAPPATTFNLVVSSSF